MALVPFFKCTYEKGLGIKIHPVHLGASRGERRITDIAL